MTLSPISKVVPMNITPPAAGIQAGRTAGGGLLDSITGGAGATQGAPPAQSDGSVGLFDGVLKKALIGGAAGVGLGFLPFIPGGPILGGIAGAMIGAGIGMFSNYRKMKAIKEENAALIGQLGLQPQTAAQAEVLLRGQPQMLLDPNITGAPMQGGPAQGMPMQQAPTQGIPAQQTPGVGQAPPPSGAEAAAAAGAHASPIEASGILPDTGSGVVFSGPGVASIMQETGQTSPAPTNTDQTAPPPVVDANTQPVTADAAAVAPAQAELATGGGATTQAASRELDELREQVRILEALVRKLEAESSAARQQNAA